MYPEWKIWLWRFSRTFISVFLVQIGTGLTNIETPSDVWKAVLLPALSGALVALGKVVRDKFAKDYPILERIVF